MNPAPEVIIPNLNKRFSGITATVAAVLPHQSKSIKVATIGHPIPGNTPHLTWWDFFRLTKDPLPNGKPRIFHARRNNEMLAGLLLKKFFRRKIHLIFTSTAQRKHSRWTRFLYFQMDTLLSTSPKAASFLLRKPKGIIPHGVDTSIYTPAKDKTISWKEGGLKGKRGIGIFGRVRPQKGLTEFVHALCKVLPQHPDFIAVIIGETTPKFKPFVENLKKEIEKEGLTDRFCWLGKLPFNEIPKWFERMSLVACVSHNEGFGLTCLEAMASGCPVVGTRTGAFEMIIREGIDGTIIPCRDKDALVEAFSNLLNSLEKLDQMGKAARDRMLSNFRIEQEASRINEIYKEIIN